MQPGYSFSSRLWFKSSFSPTVRCVLAPISAIAGCSRHAAISSATSRAVARCPGASRPCGLAKCEPVIPSSAAFSVLSFAKASSLPAVCRASAVAASFPETSSSPQSSSSTL